MQILAGISNLARHRAIPQVTKTGDTFTQPTLCFLLIQNYETTAGSLCLFLQVMRRMTQVPVEITCMTILSSYSI